MGYYYLRARYYMQGAGRFNRLDPFAGVQEEPGSLHKYAYGHGNPVSNLDPSGQFTLVELLVVVAVLTFLAAVVGELLTRRRTKEQEAEVRGAYPAHPRYSRSLWAAARFLVNHGYAKSGEINVLVRDSSTIFIAPNLAPGDAGLSFREKIFLPVYMVDPSVVFANGFSPVSYADSFTPGAEQLEGYAWMNTLLLAEDLVHENMHHTHHCWREAGPERDARLKRGGAADESDGVGRDDDV